MLALIIRGFLKSLLLLLLRARRFFFKNTISSPSIYCFAYGANLDKKRFEKYYMNAIEVGVAVARDFSLSFSQPCQHLGKGYGNVSPQKDCEVWGLVFRLDRPSLWLLDIMESLPFGYYRREKLPVQLQDGKIISVEVYRACHPKEGLLPSTEYKNLILKAGTRLRFPSHYLEVLRQIPSRNHFEIDPGYSLLFAGRRKFAERMLYFLYSFQAKIIEKIFHPDEFRPIDPELQWQAPVVPKTVSEELPLVQAEERVSS